MKTEDSMQENIRKQSNLHGIRAITASVMVGMAFFLLGLYFVNRNKSLNNKSKMIAQSILTGILILLLGYIVYQQKSTKKDNRTSSTSHSVTSALHIIQRNNNSPIPISALSVTTEIALSGSSKDDEVLKQLEVLNKSLRRAILSNDDSQIRILQQQLALLNKHTLLNLRRAMLPGANISSLSPLFNHRVFIKSLLRNPVLRLKVLRNVYSGELANALRVYTPSRMTENKLPVWIQEYNMHQLVIAYNDPKTIPVRKQQLEKIIIEIIEQFAQTKIWMPELLEVVVPLGACNNPKIAKALLEKFLLRLDKSKLLDTSLVSAISQLLRFANHRLDDGSFNHFLDGDDLMQVLILITQQLEKWKISAVNEEKLIALLQPLSLLLDAMIDQKVPGLDEEKTKAVAECLRGLQEDDNRDYDVLFYAAYSYQALIRLPDERSQLSQFFGCGLKIIKGAVTVCSSAWSMDPFAVIEGIGELKDNLSETVSTVQRKRRQSWYETLRVIEKLISSRQKDIVSFRKILYSRSLIPDEKLIHGIVCKLLPMLISTEPQIRRQVYQWLYRLAGLGKLQTITTTKSSDGIKSLRRIFQAKPPEKEMGWPSYKRVQQRILHYIQTLPPRREDLMSLEKRYREHLVLELNKELSKNTKSQTVQLIDHPNKPLQITSSDALTITGPPANSSEIQTSSTEPNKLIKELIIRAYRKKLPIDFRIENIWMQMQEYLQSQDVSQELLYYVPLQCVEQLKDLENEQAAIFDLQQKVQSFLDAGDSNVMLIQGPWCAGKSVFGRYLLRSSWSRYTPGDAIHLYIPLGQLSNPDQRCIEQVLENLGCTAEEIQILKRECRFIFYLDGFDEIKTYKNLYQCNNLHEWRAKVIITCQLGKLPSDYHGLFKANNNSYLQEYFIAPFKLPQITHYLTLIATVNCNKIKDKQEQQKQIALESETLKQKLTSLQGILQLIQNPFILKIIVEILPDLEKKQSSGEIIKFTCANVYEAFVERLFNREEVNVRNARDLKLQKSFRLRPSFQKFSEDLAWTMLLNNQTSVPVSPNEYRTLDEIRDNPWERFFTEKDNDIRASRRGAPLKYTGNNVEFIQGSVGSYFVACRLINEINAIRNHEKELNDCIYFNKILLVSETVIFEFFQGFIQDNQNIIEILFNMILFSRDNEKGAIMAANAASLLAFMRVPFSGRNLSGVKIRHANLTAAILDHTNFSNADLTGVNLSFAWLRGTDFSGAIMDVNFGEKPCLQHPLLIRQMRFNPKDEQLAIASGQSVYMWHDKLGLQNIFTGHSNDVTCLAYSPDGARLISAGKDKKLCLWDIKSGDVKHILTENIITCIVFHPHGKIFLSGNRDSILQLWDVNNDIPPHSILDHKGRITSVTFDNSGDIFASSSHLEFAIHIWDTKTRTVKRLLHGHNGIVSSLAFHPSKLLLASGSDDFSVILWDINTGELQSRLAGPSSWVMDLCFSPDGEMVATGSWDNMVRIWELKTKSLQRVYQNHTLPVLSLGYNHTGDQIASTGGCGVVQLWNPKSMELRRNETGHTSGVRCVAIRSQGGLVASASIDNTIRLWDPKTGTLQHIFTGHKGEVRSVSFSIDGTLLASASNDKTVQIWELKSRRLLRSVNAHQKEIVCVVFSPDKMTFATSSWDNTVKLWNINGTEVLVLKGHEGAVFSIKFSHDGNTLVSASRDQTIRIWDAKTGEIRNILKGHTGEVRSVDIFGDDIISASHDETVRRWSLKTGEFKTKYVGETSEIIESVVFSPNGSMIAAACNTTVCIWETQTGRILSLLKGFLNQVNSLAWHEKEGLFTGSADHSVKCWRFVDNKSKNFIWHLIWSTHAKSLIAEECQLNNIKSLTSLNAKLLAQRGAKIGTEYFTKFVIPDRAADKEAAATNIHLPPEKLSSSVSVVTREITRPFSTTVDFMFLGKERLTVVIETARLQMESVTTLDFDEFIQLFGQPENVVTYADGKITTADRIKLRIALWVNRWLKNDPFSALAVYKKDTGEFIGVVVLGQIEKPGTTELAYIFNKKFWGNGYGREAVTAVVKKYALKLIEKNYKIGKNDFNEIFATSREDNIASNKILIDAGLHKTPVENMSYGYKRLTFSLSKAELMQSNENQTPPSSTASAIRSNQ